MVAWFMGNLGSIVVLMVLVAIVTMIIRTMRRDKKQGKSCCGGNCAYCKMCAAAADKRKK